MIIHSREATKKICFSFFFFLTACRVDATQGWISAGEHTYIDLFRSKDMTDRDY